MTENPLSGLLELPPLKPTGTPGVGVDGDAVNDDTGKEPTVTLRVVVERLPRVSTSVSVTA